MTQKSLRKALGVVPQETSLFNDTLAANIGYSRRDASREAIEQATRAARLYDQVVGSFPQGFDTVVGERGMKLSGGQRQR